MSLACVHESTTVVRMRGLPVVACWFAIVGCGSSGGGDDAGDPDAPPGVADVRVVLGGDELAPETERALELGSTRVDGFHPAYELTVENPGTAELALELVIPEGFLASAPETLAPGATATLTLAMASDTGGMKQGRVELRTPVAGKTYFAFALTGNVVDAFDNPMWTTPSWKLWFEDPAAVSYTGVDQAGTSQTVESAPPAEATRKFPTVAALAATLPGTAWLGTEVAPATPAAAGWWDDGVGTMDRGHSVIPLSFGSLNLGSQLSARVTFGSPSSTQLRGLGLNYTSESYSGRGHAITRFDYAAQETERTWFFGNAVRGSPSYLSYVDTDAEHVADNYDGLFAQSYQSFGRSSSEVHGLLKMLIAGGYMPRATKELLKRHGLYAPAMITLFRQALPWVAADGSPLPYEHELRHRPAYLSNGDLNSYLDEFGPVNKGYHQYPNTQHLYDMVQGAEALTTAPPTGLIELIGVEQAGTAWQLTDPRIKVNAETFVTVWPDRGQPVTVRVDLGESIDLEDGDLDFTADVVYPNQASALRVEREGKTAIFRITATPDPALPLGRMPVLLQAHVRGLRSNPLFVNIYFPQEGQIDAAGGYFNVTSDPKQAVFWNARPVITTSLGAATNVDGQVGAPLSFTVTCTDPEGYPTAIYRRPDEGGTLAGDTYTRTPTARGTSNATFICSDGTGAYSSTQITITVP